MKRRNRRGFTLVEIMIVVAIIGLLAAIAIPNYVNSRATAAGNACIANLRQLDSAIQMFQVDNGAWPAAFADLAPYLRSVPTTCPDDGAALTFNAAAGGNPCYSSCAAHGNVAGI